MNYILRAPNCCWEVHLIPLSRIGVVLKHMETNPTASPNVVLSTTVTDDQTDRRHPGLKSDPEAPDGDTWWLTASHYHSVRILPCRKGMIRCQILNISFPVMNGRCWRISGRNHTSPMMLCYSTDIMFICNLFYYV